MIKLSAIGLPFGGKIVHYYTHMKTVNLGYEIAGGVYYTFIKKNAQKSGLITDVEHAVFLMYFFRWYFYGTSSVAVIQELQPFITMLLTNKAHSLGSFFLASLYKGMHALLEQIQEYKFIDKIQGPIWFMQLWAQLYFKDFTPAYASPSSPSGTRILGSQLIVTPIKPLEPLEILRTLFHPTPIETDRCLVLERGSAQSGFSIRQNLMLA